MISGSAVERSDAMYLYLIAFSLMLAGAFFFVRFFVRWSRDLLHQYAEGWLGCALSAAGYLLALASMRSPAAGLTAVDAAMVAVALAVAGWAVAVRLGLWGEGDGSTPANDNS
jgi:hypothetical protein